MGMTAAMTMNQKNLTLQIVLIMMQSLCMNRRMINERNSQSLSNEKYHLKKKRRNSIESKKQTRIVTPDKKEIIPYRVKM